MEEQETGNRPSQPQWRDDMNVMSKVHRKFHTLLFAEGYDGMIQAPIPILVKNKERAKECWYPPNSRHLYLHAPRTSVKRSCRENDVCSRFRWISHYPATVASLVFCRSYRHSNCYPNEAWNSPCSSRSKVALAMASKKIFSCTVQLRAVKIYWKE